MRRPQVRGLYVIADTALLPAARLPHAVERAVRGGAALVQYRNKTANAQDVALPTELLAVCRARGVPLIVNDDVRLAMRVGADGVHLGRDDESVATARRELGPAALIGASCYNDFSRALRCRSEGADYVAFGSFFPSPTKPSAVSASPDLLRRARDELYIPAVAIGGITPRSGARLIRDGAAALAVISGVFAQPDPEAAARAYARLFAPAPRARSHA